MRLMYACVHSVACMQPSVEDDETFLVLIMNYNLLLSESQNTPYISGSFIHLFPMLKGKKVM